MIQFNTNRKNKKKSIEDRITTKNFKEGSKTTKKNILQQAIIDDWADNGYDATYLISMGVGKSRIIAKAINKFFKNYNPNNEDKYDVPVLVLVNSTALRDTGLPQELEKWHVKYRPYIRIECYQFAYKNKQLLRDKIGLLICDEVDFCISPKLSACIEKTNPERRLLLTGTLSEEKRELVKDYTKFPPIRFEYDVHRAQKDEVINQTKIFLHAVPLDTTKNIKIEYKDKRTKKTKTFLSSENGQYIYVQDKINSYRKLMMMNKDSPKAYGKFAALKSYYETSPKNSNSRVAQMTQNKSLVDYANKLSDILLEDNPENKVIFFAKRTETIDQMTPNGYYKKVSDEIIERFNVGEIRTIGVCKKANRGVSFVGLNHCIAQSYDSSETDQNQGVIGRMTRLDTDEVAYVHILISTYTTVGNTQDYCWNYNWVQKLIDSRIEDVILVEDINDTLNLIKEFETEQNKTEELQ